MTVGRIFISISWIPLALFVATWVYIRQYDGWGAWAAAPLIIPSLALSLGFGLYGVWLYREAQRAGELTWRHGAAALFASGPILVVVLSNLLGF